MYLLTLSFLMVVLLSGVSVISESHHDGLLTYRPHYVINPVTPYYYVCPGINDTAINESPIRVGVMVSLPSEADCLEAVGNSSNNSHQLLPGDLLLPFSPIARAALKQGTIINQKGMIPTNHTLCLYFTFVPHNLMDTTLGSNNLYTHGKTYQTINALTDPYQFTVNRDLMVSFGNMINVLPPSENFQCPISPNAFNVTFSGIGELYDKDCEPGVFNTNLKINFDSIQLVRAAKLFMEFLGWKRYGVLTTCSDQEIWQLEDQGLFLSQYIEGNFLKSFEVFQKNEISVILFIGSICSYFDFLIQAYDYGLASCGKFAFVLAIQNFSPICYLANSLDGSSCDRNFTDIETFKIKTSIDKTIVVYPRCRCRFAHVDAFTDPNLSTLERCMQMFMSDAVTLSARTASEVLRQKAMDTGSDVSLLYIEKTDYTKVTNALLNASLLGRTGLLQFDTGCHRVANVFAASNILIHEEDFNARTFNCCGLDVKAYILARPDGLDVLNFVVNEVNVDTSPFVFKDNTTNIPRDSPKRPYLRNNAIAIGCIFLVAGLYIASTALYILYIYWKDAKVLKYSSNWMVDQRDINPVALCGMFTQAWQAERFACPAPDGSYTRVQELSHSNLCSFSGCVSSDSRIIGIMFEHTARKNLHEILTNPHLELSEANRNSFCLNLIYGLQYLHHKQVCHGRLNSINCLIDENWTVKLTNFGLHSLYSKQDRSSEYKFKFTALDWKAPECRLLACRPSRKADIYSLGALFKEIGCRRSLISMSNQRDSNTAWRTSQLVFDQDVPAQFQQLVEGCMCNSPGDRLTLDVLKLEMKNVASLEQKLLKNEGFGALEVYSSNLERQVEEVVCDLENEREFSDAILSNYIPEAVILKARKGVPVPVRVYRNGVLLYVQLNRFNELFNKYTTDIASGIISNIDKQLVNISKRYQLERVQYNGSLWVYVGGVYTDTAKVSIVISSIKAALELLNEFRQHQEEVTITVALHSGPLMCGLMSETNQVHVTAGDTFHEGMKLLSLASAMKVSISEAFMKKLDYFSESQDVFTIEKYKSFKIDENEEVNIYQVWEMSLDEEMI